MKLIFKVIKDFVKGKELDEALELLTDIQLETTDRAIFKYCEKLREQLVNSWASKSQGNEVVHSRSSRKLLEKIQVNGCSSESNREKGE